MTSHTDAIRSITLAAGNEGEPCTMLATFLEATAAFQGLAVEADWSGRVAVRGASAHQSMRFSDGLGRAEVEEVVAAARAIVEAVEGYYDADTASDAITEALPVNPDSARNKAREALDAHLGGKAEVVIEEKMDAILGALPHGLLSRNQMVEAIRERFEVLADIDRREIFGGARITWVVVEGEDWSAQSDAEYRWGEPEAMGYKVTTPLRFDWDEVHDALTGSSEMEVEGICAANGWELDGHFDNMPDED